MTRRPLWNRMGLMLVLIAMLAGLAGSAFAAPRENERERELERARARQRQARLTPPQTEQVVAGTTVNLAGSAVVNFADLARFEQQQRAAGLLPPTRVLMTENEQNEDAYLEPYAGPRAIEPANALSPLLNVSSPAPTQTFAGLDDIPMADSSYIIIPPDVGGAVGPSKVMCTFNNNYRIQDKATGATLLTVGTATFWNPVVTNKALLNQLTDPRTTYDPVNNRWIVCMQTTNSTGLILFGVSQTNDPAGAWYLYAVTPGFTSSPRLDFPIIGFNKNWIAVTINAYTSAGAFNRGGCMIASYPLARAGTLASVTNVTQAAGTHFCTAPCVTLSATEDTLFLVTHLSSASATLQVDRITGTTTPTYTSGATYTRPGGGWVQPSGNYLPQSAPNSGTSSCGATPCLIEGGDSQVRGAPLYRVDPATGRGYIWYSQTVGLPAVTMTHTGIQWTKITAGISATAPTSANAQFADGGRIEDATATATNGGKWYAYSHIAVNSLGDFLVGYSQFSSAQHPAAGYSYHDHTDGTGTMRDPLVYKAGDDYYHKDFGSGRNRWGDFSTVQVDPSDDASLWALQEYGKTRTSTDDGTTGANGSKWASYWAKLTPGTYFTINASAGAGGTVSPSGAVSVAQGANQAFTIAANSCFQIADVLVDGVSQGPITTYTFTNVQAAHTISATFSALGPYAIAASAGANGSISPAGTTNVNCGANQAYTISAASCYHVADVLVDGVSVGAVTTYTFTNVQAPHTISASFAINGPYTITASAGANGSITPAGATVVTCGGSQAYSITADPCYHVTNVVVDGVSQGAITSYAFNNVQAGHTISATFAINTYTIAASSTAGGTISPSGTLTFNCGANQTYTLAANSGYYLSSLVVDGSSVTPALTYAFTDVQANHTIAATWSVDVATIAAASSGTPLCPTNTCVTLPVTFSRNGATPVLGFSVTFQLSPELALCSGTSSITEGTFLSGSGATLFNVVNHGGGLYTADGALTSNCGPTATSGTLFSIGVSSASPGGTGTVTVTSLKLRDCNNAVLSAVAGPAGSVAIDNQAPVVAVTAPNGGEALLPGQAFAITWTATDNVGVANVDLAYSTDGGATYPNAIAAAIPNSGSYAWTVPGVASSSVRVRVTAHDVNCSSAADASDANFSIGGSIVAPGSPTACLTPANACVTVPVDIVRSDAVGMRLFHVDFTLSPNLQLCGPPGMNVLEGTYLSNANPSTSFFVVDNGGGSYTADGTINGTPCGATDPTGNLFNIKVAANGTGIGTVTLNSLTLRDCFNNEMTPANMGPAAQVHIDTAPVSIAAIPTPQSVVETHLLTITPALTLSACATGPVTWTVSPALPSGATFNTSTGEIQWTPACGSVGSYGPFTLTATAASGDAATTNAFTIQVTHQAGVVTVAAIADPQTVDETSTLTITPSVSVTACGTGPFTWTVSPALPAGATFNSATGEIVWTPACGEAGNYGPFTLTATAATGEAGNSNAFAIHVTHHNGVVTVAAIADPQNVVETSTLTVTPSASVTACGTGPFTWTVSPALPSGATFDGSTGEIVWTPACGTAGSYGPFTLTATAATGEAGNSNAFSIVVAHLTGSVTVAAIADPQTIDETSTLTITPSAATTACAGSLTWSVSPALPSGATFSTATGEIVWTPACGTVGHYGPFTLTATAATGEAGSSNAFEIHVTHHTGSVAVAAIADPQTIDETSTLTITPSATLTACASGPLTWTVSPALPAGATFSSATGEIVWTPACGELGNYGPFTLTATAATGEAGSSNAFAIHVTHHTGVVTVAAIADPQNVVEMSTLTVTPSASLTACASGPFTWSVSPALPSGATFNTASGEIVWTPACGTAGNYGPFTLTATAATGEAGSSNAFAIVVAHLAGTVTVAAIADPQSVDETSTLTVTPSASLTACATAPLTWSVSPALPSGATFSTATGEIVWTPACGTVGHYGPFTLTATASTGEAGSSNAFAIDVTHHAGTVTVAAIADPQSVDETSTLTITPSATLGACAAGPVTWTVSPALPSGATFDGSTGEIVWTPACGTVGNYGPFTLTAHAATGETGSSNAFAIHVTHHAGVVTVAAIADPQNVVEMSTLTVTPSASLTACATGPFTWTVSPALPSGATFDGSTGEIVWTPACGTAGNYGPFTLTATAATGEAGNSNAFAIVVAHRVGTVTVAAIADPQTVAELSLLTITPSASLTACAAAPLAWTVAPALPAGASLDGTTGVITWTPDCSAAQGGASGTYGPFTLTATAATGEAGSSNAFSIHVTDTPTSIAAPTSVTAAQVLTGNPAGEVTGITVNFTGSPGAVAYQVYRAPFGQYPYYDDNGGAAPAQPTAYPPASPWLPTTVTASGGTDHPATRDWWYYVVYAQNACGDWSVASTMTGGTLGYHLGDVTDGFVLGTGDNLVTTADISSLGANYGITLGASDPLGFLDVGPTTTHYVDGRPLTDRKVNFEDLVLFAINFFHVSAPSLAATPAPAKSFASDQLVLSSPDLAAPGERVRVPLTMQGTGAVQAMSVQLSWDPAVVKPAGLSAGDFLRDLDGVAMSAKSGSVDVAVLGKGRGVTGEGELAAIEFEVIAAGDPRIRIEKVDARDTRNEAVVLATSRTVAAAAVPTVTGLRAAMPNPFRSNVTLEMSLSHGAPVELSIYSVDGRRVRTVASGAYDAGVYRFTWDGRGDGGEPMAAGVYYARMTAGREKFVRTLTYLK